MTTKQLQVILKMIDDLKTQIIDSEIGKLAEMPELEEIGKNEELEMKKMDVQNQKQERTNDDFDDHDDVLRNEPPEEESETEPDSDEEIAKQTRQSDYDDYNSSISPL